MDGKIVVVAGGSGGLGQGVVPAFRKAGARVITADRHPPAALMEQGTAMQAASSRLHIACGPAWGGPAPGRG